MLSKDLEHTLNDAFRGAREKRHEFMTVEHLLLALLDNNVSFLPVFEMLWLLMKLQFPQKTPAPLCNRMCPKS